MNKPCPPGQIRNPVSKRCINMYGPTAKKLGLNVINTQDQSIPSINNINNLKPCPPGQIENPVSKRCINMYGPTAKKLGLNVINTVNNNSIDTPLVQNTTTCSNLLKDTIQQCDCPICWIVSTIVAIKYSKLYDYFTPEYKKIVNDAYKVFSSPYEKDLCPYIPKKVLTDYVIRLRQRGFDTPNVKNLFKNEKGGIVSIFMYSLIKNALKENYYINISTDYMIDNLPENPFYENGDFFIQRVSLTNFSILNYLTRASTINNLLILMDRYFVSKGYKFYSGTITFKSKGKDDYHSVAFNSCNNKFYVCNSYRNKCVELINSNYKKLKSLDYFESIKDLFFIILPI